MRWTASRARQRISCVTSSEVGELPVPDRLRWPGVSRVLYGHLAVDLQLGVAARSAGRMRGTTGKVRVVRRLTLDDTRSRRWGGGVEPWGSTSGVHFVDTVVAGAQRLVAERRQAEGQQPDMGAARFELATFTVSG